MSYYRGDYYRGDYYRGDPGVFSFLGKVLKTIGPVARKISPFAGLIGGAAGLAARALTGGSGTALMVRPPQLPMLGGGGFGGGGGPLPPVLVGGGQSGVPLRPQLAGGCDIKGLHMNKSAYVTRGGGTSHWPAGQLLLHPKGTECVKVRRINVANPRALRRALRRAAGFVKLARRAHVRLASFTGRKGKKKSVR